MGAVGDGCFSLPSPCPSYTDVLFVTTPSRNMLEFNLRSEKLILFSPKAPQVKAMVDHFITELRKVGGCPRAREGGWELVLGARPCLGAHLWEVWVGKWRAPRKWDHAWGEEGLVGTPWGGPVAVGA